MKFNINAPFWQFMNTLARFTALNVVCLLTMVPLVTIGTARTALYSTLFAYDEHDDIALVREYLRRFRREFKISTISWVLLFALVAVVVFGIAFWMSWDTNASYVPLVLLIAAAVGVALITEYLAPLQARFDNSLGRLWHLAAAFPWRAFPCSLILVVIDVFAIGIAYYVPFIRVFALIFGVAWVAYAKSLILLWGFKRYGGMGKVENPTYVNAHE